MTNPEDDALIGMLAAVASEDESTDALIEDAAGKLAETKGMSADTFIRQAESAASSRAPLPESSSPTGAVNGSVGIGTPPAPSTPSRPSPFAEAMASRPISPTEDDEGDGDDLSDFSDPRPLPDTSNPVSDAEVVTSDPPIPLWAMGGSQLDDLEDDYSSYDNPPRDSEADFTVDPPLPPLPSAAGTGSPRMGAPRREPSAPAFDEFDDFSEEPEEETTDKSGGGALGSALGSIGGMGHTLIEKIAFKDRPLAMKAAIIALPVVIIVGLIASMLSPSGKTPPPVATETQAVPTTSAVENNSEQVLNPARVEAECGPPRTNASLAFSKDAANAWVCPRAFGADGAVLNIFFDKPVVITRISFVPGWPGDNWKKTRVPSLIVWNFGKGNKPLKQAPLPEPAPSVLDVPKYGVTEMSAQILTTVPTDPNPADKTKSRSEASDKSFAMTKLQIFGYVAGNTTIGGEDPAVNGGN